MPIKPINNVRNASRVVPVQPVQRPQAAGLRFKLPGTEQAGRPVHRRRSSPGRRLVIHEDGWVREYGMLPDGTRILLAETPEHKMHALPMQPVNERSVSVSPSADEHDPECSMRISGRKLKSLLEDEA
ncbi:hypothetical protein [Saccharibacillus alkalitolerans]|uniref:Uncharacterized protein n=1 Tax=Saccharibacillus alkalitolerans TaxID=2705290 RepID=A0ABX0F3R7_9BACL|nr:hypothetical protein [Saccharibacillus alkalitolerans]NGZ75013.1 hypothetical protein [Saccharibacillus alkalitolerans]